MGMPDQPAIFPLRAPHATASNLTPFSSFAPFPKAAIEQAIPVRFEEYVRQYSGKIAVKTTTEQRSYAELNQAANRIAHALLDQYGSDSEPVVLLCGQGIQLIATILGVLKSGKFYVPLDPTHPVMRNQMLVADAAARVIVADADYRAVAEQIAQEQPQCTVVCVDELSHELPTTNPGVPIAPDALAYMFYTSGTTGRPKGVIDSHRNVLHNMMRYTNRLAICPDDGLTLLQSSSFSGSVSNIFGALLNGATLFPFDVQRDGLGKIAAWLEQESITIYHSVPALFRSFLLDDRSFPRIRIIRLEGDQASKKDVELYKRPFGPDCLLVNGLGATECGIVRQLFIDKQTEITGVNVPIGYAVEDMDVLVVDDDGLPVATGSIGEIVVESRYLALGYWNNPERTAAAFRSTTEPGVRRYHTGDLGRMDADGCLEHLGRKDFQAKIRGNFIDTAEVEAALLDMVGIAEAVAQVREDDSDEPQLVAYVVEQRNNEPHQHKDTQRVPGTENSDSDDCSLSPARGYPVLCSADLRQFLQNRLPDYMIPSAFVVLDALPLTANGKVDRRALPKPDRSIAQSTIPFVAPRTPPEAILAEIWSTLLDIESVSIHANFFDLGGHSLLAHQIITRTQQVFQVDVPIRSLFEAPTIAMQADLIMDLLLDEIEALPEPDV